MIKPTISYIQLISILFTVLVINPVKAVEPPPPSSQQLPSRSGVADSLNQRLPRLKPTTEKMYKLTLLEYPEKINFPADNIFLR
ncbi:MAG: hypothetical protein NTY89_15590 [Nostocales cyanobacterium LacPavin_0920_SED1_MAG_38_18]|nr:hypothetical protein [Nostocales cyanobacterium LacPavin_0920_SED1_MAG_38_18]